MPDPAPLDAQTIQEYDSDKLIKELKLKPEPTQKKRAHLRIYVGVGIVILGLIALSAFKLREPDDGPDIVDVIAAPGQAETPIASKSESATEDFNNLTLARKMVAIDYGGVIPTAHDPVVVFADVMLFIADRHFQQSKLEIAGMCVEAQRNLRMKGIDSYGVEILQACTDAVKDWQPEGTKEDFTFMTSSYVMLRLGNEQTPSRSHEETAEIMLDAYAAVMRPQLNSPSR